MPDNRKHIFIPVCKLHPRTGCKRPFLIICQRHFGLCCVLLSWTSNIPSQSLHPGRFFPALPGHPRRLPLHPAALLTLRQESCSRPHPRTLVLGLPVLFLLSPICPALQSVDTNLTHPLTAAQFQPLLKSPLPLNSKFILSLLCAQGGLIENTLVSCSLLWCFIVYSL